jgi:lipopolysaccharide transport system permease protein
MSHPLPTLLIRPGSADKYYWLDLWSYRELFYVLAWRDISVRYKQTVIGVAWAVIRPLLTMIIFTLIFGNLAKLPVTDGVPYALLVFAGLLPWQLFSASVSESANSLIANSNLVSKVYFPRLVIPIATMMTALVDFVISLTILALIMFWYGYAPTWRIFTLPLFVLMALLASFGPGVLLAALNVRYRDFRYAIPFLLQLGLYLSPVGFSSSIVPEQWRFLYSLNPLVGVIDGFRWAITGKESIYLPGFFVSWIFILLLVYVGVLKFRKMEKSFSDLM